MSKIQKEINHGLQKDEALSRIKSFLGSAKDNYPDTISCINEEWLGYDCIFSFKIHNADVKGTMKVEESTLIINAEIPFWMKPFAPKIENILENEAGRIF